jgi:predicted secreted protein
VRAGIRPAEFWRMTPAEVHLVIEGYHERQDDFGERLAFLAYVIAAPHYPRRMQGQIGPDRLWPRTLERADEPGGPIWEPDEIERVTSAVNSFMRARSAPPA